MAIGGVTSGVASGSYRDQWNNKDLLEEDDEKTEGTGSTDKTHVWNAVFEEKKTGVTADDFLTLMVAQLTNQDFMNPVDDSQYVTQMAQITTMQQMTELANYSKTSYVMSLVGKNVTAAKITVSGELQGDRAGAERQPQQQRVHHCGQQEEVHPGTDHGNPQRLCRRQH